MDYATSLYLVMRQKLKCQETIQPCLQEPLMLPFCTILNGFNADLSVGNVKKDQRYSSENGDIYGMYRQGIRFHRNHRKATLFSRLLLSVNSPCDLLFAVAMV